MSAPKEMPRYLCHKEVQALKIKRVDFVSMKGSYLLTFEEAGYDQIEVAASWVDKHGPKAGGYYVKYKDGYTSYSPARAFEEGYTAVQE